MGAALALLRGGKAAPAEGDDGFDYSALEEAQKAGTDGAAEGDARGDKRKQRGGAKESKQRRKKARREDDILRAKKAGLPVPSLRDALAAASSSGASPSGAASSGAVAPAAPAAAPQPEPTAGAAAAPAAALVRGVASYDDAEGEKDDPRQAAALARVARETARRARVAEVMNERTAFVTNLSFKVTEQELRDRLGKAGTIRSIRFSRDKATTHLLGYAHVQFEAASSVAAAMRMCDGTELHDRVMRVATTGEKVEFRLPEEIKEDFRALMREAYEGKNISTIKDAWQKRHPGVKLDTARWGFKNFSSAFRTVEGVSLEKNLDKCLTDQAYFTGSPAHAAHLEAKRLKDDAEAEQKKRALDTPPAEAQPKAKKQRVEGKGGGKKGGGAPSAGGAGGPAGGGAPSASGGDGPAGP